VTLKDSRRIFPKEWRLLLGHWVDLGAIANGKGEFFTTKPVLQRTLRGFTEVVWVSEEGKKRIEEAEVSCKT